MSGAINFPSQEHGKRHASQCFVVYRIDSLVLRPYYGATRAQDTTASVIFSTESIAGRKEILARAQQQFPAERIR